MMERILKALISAFILLTLTIQVSYAQHSHEPFAWPAGKKAAVCLTFDDALDNHLDIVAPMLDSFEVRGTFYCSGFSPTLRDRMEEWRAVSKNGHEIGNHMLFHPCDGRGYDWVPEEYDLSTYSTSQYETEAITANTLLEAIDGKKERSFAYTCSNFRVEGDSSIYRLVEKLFPSARNQGPIPVTMDSMRIHFMPSMVVNGHSGRQLIDYVEQAREKGTIAIFMFHGVGGGHFLDVDPAALEELLIYLKQNQADYWVDTFYTVAGYISLQREQAQKAPPAPH